MLLNRPERGSGWSRCENGDNCVPYLSGTPLLLGSRLIHEPENKTSRLFVNVPWAYGDSLSSPQAAI
jgi:hypothetical protein